ncbi:MAG: HRDC domain-containing protein [Anaerolineaceae bacterium]|nr:HRDC domain-containing protein [Anaerolineaceae bacterium]
MGVESDVVLSRDILEMIADKNPQSALKLKEIMAPVPVRYEQFGRSILESLEKVRIHP